MGILRLFLGSVSNNLYIYIAFNIFLLESGTESLREETVCGGEERRMRGVSLPLKATHESPRG
jgi:hypothetical protein